MRSRAVVLVIAASALAVALASSSGCSGTNDDPAAPVCIDAGIDPTCTPAYEPTWDALFTKTFKPGCAFSGVSCHAAKGHQGNLNFEDIDAAYTDVTHGKVVPGKPECSTIVHRIVSTDGNERMPPAAALSAGEKCAIAQWITAGAKR